jgi:exopolysaccharide biosynthesis protein
VRRNSKIPLPLDMPKKQSSLVVDQSQGFVMTDQGLLIPGKFLQQMGRTISVAFSPWLIVISSDRSSDRIRKSEQRSEAPRTKRGRKSEP